MVNFARALTPTRVGALLFVPAALLALGATSVSAAALPTSTAIDFTADGYTVAPLSPAGQNGWVGARTDIDFALVDNASFPNAGLPAGRSLQFSNSTVKGGGTHLTSPLIASAGEPSTSATANTFDVTFTVASATGALQPGLGVDVAIDGASRYGGVVNLRHGATGLEVGSYWVPYGATSADVAQWRSAVFTTVDATKPHTIRVVTMFLAGRADTFDVYVDGILVSGGSGVTTWETYSAIAGTGGDNSVDSISFKTSSSAPSPDGIGYVTAAAAPATLDLGYLFSGISYSVREDSPALPTAPPALPPAPEATPDAPVEIPAQVSSEGRVEFSASGFLPYENVYATIYSVPVFAGWFQADALGVVSGSFAAPTGLPAGSHTFQLTGATSGFVAASAIQVLALAATGTEATPVVVGGALALLAGGALVLIARGRRANS